MRIVFFCCFLFLINSCTKRESKTTEKLQPLEKRVDHYLQSLIKADEIPGMAVAVIKDVQIIHEKYYGLANIAHNVPVSENTLFRVYSTTKLITSVAVFQLIEKGKISLDDSISRYIDNLPKSWNTIKIEHLLSCSSGLPEYKNFDSKISNKELFNQLIKEPLHFEAGYKYEYNQTNYWFLKLIIEKVTSQSFEDFIQKSQFKDREEEVLFASNSLVDYPNRVSKYQYNNEYKAYEKTTYAAGNRSLAGNGMNINLKALLDWNKKLDDNQLLQSETKHLMMSPYAYKNNRFPFGYSWGIYGPEEKKYYGFTGGGVSAFMKFIDKDLTIVILSNGFKNRPIIANAITYISGLIDKDLQRKDRMLNEDIRLAFILNNYKNAIEIYDGIQQENQDVVFERGLNSASLHYINSLQVEKSIAIFKFYTEKYPSSSNAFNRLGDAYFNNKQFDMAKINYQKALALDSNNKKAKKMIKIIEDN